MRRILLAAVVVVLSGRSLWACSGHPMPRPHQSPAEEYTPVSTAEFAYTPARGQSPLKLAGVGLGGLIIAGTAARALLRK